MKSKKCCLLLILVFLNALVTFANPDQVSIYKVPFDIGGQFFDYQNYQAIPYLHGGMDLCAPAGTEVFTPVSGKVVISDYTINASAKPHKFTYTRRAFKRGDVSSTRYLEVAVTTADKTVWMFRHIDAKSIPGAIFTAVEKNATIATGTVIGKVASWLQPVLPEKRIYDHIHLEILTDEGYYLNPASLVKTTKDYYPPTIHSIYAARHGSNDAQILDAGNKTVSGNIDLIFGVNDRMNQAAYQHSVYRAAWALEKVAPDGSRENVVPIKEVFKFDQLPIRGDRIQLSTVIYRDSLKVGSNHIHANGHNGPRFFLVNLTCGTSQTGYAANNNLDTTKLANGRYRLKITVADFADNIRSKTVEFLVKN